MGNVNKILCYFNDLNQKFNELFFEVLKDFNEKAVHDFRVNIKKQIAFFHLLKGIDPGFQANKTEALFFRIFKNAGAIRKVHVEINILTNKDLNINVDVEILKKLKKRLVKKIEQFQQNDHTKDLGAINKKSKLIRTRILKVSGNKLNNGLNEYYSKLLRGLKKLSVSCKVNEEDFHELRKLLKELFYNLNLIVQLVEHKQLAPGILKYLDQLQTSLGEWHDIHLTLKHFSGIKKPDMSQLTGILKQKNDWYVDKIRMQLSSFEEVVSKIELELLALVK